MQGRKRERAWKQAADEHATALLAVEARLAGKQREVAGLQDINARLFSRFQDMREQLARSEDKLSHDKLRGVMHHSWYSITMCIGCIITMSYVVYIACESACTRGKPSCTVNMQRMSLLIVTGHSTV